MRPLSRVLRPIVALVAALVPPVEEVATGSAAWLGGAQKTQANSGLKRDTVAVKQRLAIIARVLRRTVVYVRECEVRRIAAALAYFTLFSLAPMVFVALAVASLVVGHNQAQSDVVGAVRPFLGDAGATTVAALLRYPQPKAASAIGVALGVLIALVGAAGLFDQLRDSMDAMWGSPEKPKRGFVGFLMDNVLAISMVMATMIVFAGSIFFQARIEIVTPVQSGWAHILSLLVTFCMMWLLLAALYTYLPPVNLVLKEALIGAAVTSILLSMGQFLMGLYLGKASLGGSFGAAGPVVATLVWVYYTALMLLVGVAFTRAYTEIRRHQNLKS